MWAIFITAILLLLSLFGLTFIYNINCFIFIIVFTFYLFILNNIKNNKKIKLTIFENILLFIVVFQTTFLVINLISNILTYFNLDLEPLYVLENNQNNNIQENNIDKTIIINYDNTWATTIRTLFIYGTAGMIICLKRGNTTAFRKVTTGVGALFADSASKVVEHSINDPSYLRAHYTNWKMIWKKDSNGNQLNDTVNVDISGDTQLTSQILKEINQTNQASGSSDTSTFLPSFDNIHEQLSSLTNDLMLPIINALKPQPVDYPIELLMDQHHVVSISLFILTITSLIFFIILLYNIILLMYKDKILNIFKNKYILMYLNLQFKIIVIENIFLIILMLNNFYFLLMGLHFLAVFPINININPY